MCDGWALIGQCLDSEAWMSENCKKSCRICGVDLSTTSTATPVVTTPLPPIETSTETSTVDGMARDTSTTVPDDSYTTMPPATTMSSTPQGSTTIGKFITHLGL